MKWHECNKEAIWIVIDQTPPYDEYFLPLCEEHFQQLKEMEGEMNLSFDLIDNLSLEDAINKFNEHNKFWQKRYENLLKECVSLRRQLSSVNTNRCHLLEEPEK